MLSTQDIYKNS